MGSLCSFFSSLVSLLIIAVHSSEHMDSFTFCVPFSSTNQIPSFDNDIPFIGLAFDQFQLRTIINSSKSNSCKSDPIPTTLLNQCSNELTPINTRIENLSLKIGSFLNNTSMQSFAHYCKKPGLETEHKSSCIHRSCVESNMPQ